MPGLRDKMRKALKRRNTSGAADENEEPTLGNTKPPGVDVYKPGKVPPSKYRGGWNKEHQDRLHGFTFTDAFSRRKSSYSDISPGQSRRNSWVDKRDKSHEPSHVGQMVENADDDQDPLDVGKARPQTGNDVPMGNGDEETILEQQRTVTSGTANGHASDTPFSPEELNRAMTASRISDRSDKAGEGHKMNGTTSNEGSGETTETPTPFTK